MTFFLKSGECTQRFFPYHPRMGKVVFCAEMFAFTEKIMPY